MVAAHEHCCRFGDSMVECPPANDGVVVTDGGVVAESSTQDDDETL